MEEEWKRSEREREALLAQIEAAQNASQSTVDVNANTFANDFDDVISNEAAQTPYTEPGASPPQQALYSLTYLEDELAMNPQLGQPNGSLRMDPHRQQSSQAMLETQIVQPDPSQASPFSYGTIEDLYDNSVNSRVYFAFRF